MWIFLTKRRLIVMTMIVLGCLTGVGIALYYDGPVFAIQAMQQEQDPPLTIVLDPGHGGEDGGAISSDGNIEEAHLNLEISLRLRDLLRFTGQRVIMTREEDVSTSDDDVTGVKERKLSDLRNRVKLVNETENAVLISVHQNSLPSSTATRGAQVFWNQEPGAQELAESIQAALNQGINQELGNYGGSREKSAKQIPSTIYLTRRSKSPGVIVECGFLSNPEDTMQLQELVHQEKLAIAIASGFLACDELRNSSESES